MNYENVEKLGDILDMETYLEERCYCPGEIYSIDGFFYQIFSPEAPCKVIASNSGGLAVITKPDSDGDEEPNAQIVVIGAGGKDHQQVRDTVRFDATENNIRLIKKYFKGETIGEDERFNEFNEGSTKKALEEIMEMADAVIID